MGQWIIELIKKIFKGVKNAMKEEEKSQEQKEKDELEGLIFAGLIGIIIIVGTCIYWLIVGYAPSVPEVPQDIRNILVSERPSEVEQGMFDSARGRRIKRLAIYAGVIVGVVGVVFLGCYILRRK